MLITNKMKLNLLQVLALMAVVNASAQSVEERIKIKSASNKEEVAALKSRLKESEQLRKARIDQYLSAHPEAKLVYYDNGRKFQIRDIVENKAVYMATDNASEALATRTNRLYPGGTLGLSLEGDGIDAGVWDGSWIRRTHQEFQLNGASRVTVYDGLGNTSELHATHVGGSVGAKGVSASAKGMAPKANLLSFEWNNDAAEVADVAAEGLLVSNHSYGVPIMNEQNEMNVPTWYPGCYNNDSRDFDEILYENPYYLHVKSAGNEGDSTYSGGFAPGVDKLTSEATCKNNLVVANANTAVNPVTGALTTLLINTSSSQGPTDDSRIKPDITADGTNVVSTSDSSDTAYATLTGTSMASPCVTGNIVLLQKHFNNLHPGTFMRSATVKALLCNTALDDSQQIGPDPRFGWGFLDAEAAANVITRANNNQNLLLEASLSSGETDTYNFTVSAASTVKATIAWTDPAGTSRQGQLNSTTPVLVNDLDLRITKGSDTYFPYKLDLSDLTAAVTGDNIVDTVERIDLENIPAGNYTLTVSHKGNLVNGMQNYSLVLSGLNLVLSNQRNTLAGVSVWPNPARDIVNIRLESAIQDGAISLYDYAGRQVYQQNIKGSGETDFAVATGSLAKGVYILKVVSGAQTMAKKVVIE